jgi:hypothetical protein
MDVSHVHRPTSRLGWLGKGLFLTPLHPQGQGVFTPPCTPAAVSAAAFDQGASVPRWHPRPRGPLPLGTLHAGIGGHVSAVQAGGWHGRGDGA